MTTRPRRPKPRSQRGPVENEHPITDLFPEDRRKKPPGERPPVGRPTSTVKDEDGRPADPRKRMNFRLGKRWTQVIEEIKAGEYTWDEFCENLTPEELARGRLADSDGRFRGRASSLVPAAFHQACLRELHKRFNEKMRGRLLEATEELLRIGMNPIVPEKDRIKVLQFVIERVMGKVPDKIEVHAADPWETIITDILTESDSPVPYADRRDDAQR